MFGIGGCEEVWSSIFCAECSRDWTKIRAYSNMYVVQLVVCLSVEMINR